jgi:hypothetical protein
MADKYTYRSGPKDVEFIPIASGTVAEIGDLLKLSSGKCLKMATTTDNLDFCGVAAAAHYATDPSGTLAVYVPNLETVFEYDLDASTAITWGDRLQYNAAKTLKKSTTDGIALAVESKLGATKVRVKFLVPAKTGNTNRIADAS